jgi:hypothetical protein
VTRFCLFRWFLNDWLSLQFHLALWTYASFFRSHVFMHRTDVVKLCLLL